MSEATMRRVTFRLPKERIEEIEARVDAGEYPTQSEAIRTACREKFAGGDRHV